MSKHPRRPRVSKRAPTKRISAGGSRRTPPPSKAPNIAAQQKVANFSSPAPTPAPQGKSPPANAGRQQRSERTVLGQPLSEGVNIAIDTFFGKDAFRKKSN